MLLRRRRDVSWGRDLPGCVYRHVTARIMRVVLRARVRLIATAHRTLATDLAVWRSYPEFATRL